MRVLLLNDGDFGDADNVNFPVEVEALRLTDGGFFKISKGELHRVGFVDFNSQSEWFFEEGSEAVLAPVEQPNETPCIRDMCCNQFGERDEMQSIINSLQADVIARGARIKMLEDTLRATNDELQGAIENINNTLKSNICSTDLDDPDYWDFQTVHDNVMLLRGVDDE